jgi:hypothetical protein
MIEPMIEPMLGNFIEKIKIFLFFPLGQQGENLLNARIGYLPTRMPRRKLNNPKTFKIQIIRATTTTIFKILLI